MHFRAKPSDLVLLLSCLAIVGPAVGTVPSTSPANSAQLLEDLKRSFAEYEATMKPSKPSAAKQETGASASASAWPSSSGSTLGRWSWANIPAASPTKPWLYRTGAILAFLPWYMVSQLLGIIEYFFWMLGALYAYSSWLGAVFNIFLFFGVYLLIEHAVYGPHVFKETWLNSLEDYQERVEGTLGDRLTNTPPHNREPYPYPDLHTTLPPVHSPPGQKVSQLATVTAMPAQQSLSLDSKLSRQTLFSDNADVGLQEGRRKSSTSFLAYRGDKYGEYI